MIKPIVWSIAGSDSGGGAGIQVDLKTMNTLGVHGCTVITALTAQNSCGVLGIAAASPHILTAQLEALYADLLPQAVKLGMLYSEEVIEIVSKILKRLDTFVICDPVLVASSGDLLSTKETVGALISHILPQVNLLTPNLDEAHLLLNYGQKKSLENSKPADLHKYDDYDDYSVYVESLAKELLCLGPNSVLVKGGHSQGQNAKLSARLSASKYSEDFWSDGLSKAWLSSERQHTYHTHGTGCTLSSAIASCVALGYSELDALVIAKAYVNQGLRHAVACGAGRGTLAHTGWPESSADIPWLSSNLTPRENALKFAGLGTEPIGFYPLVNRAAWLEKFLPLGVKTCQLRIKDLQGEKLEEEIVKAVQLANKYHCRLFINDYWELALKHGAYGVHLGQEDLASANIKKLAAADVRLGVSSHGYAEVAQSLALNPSYIAIGPIYTTETKPMSFKPLGIAELARWRKSLSLPLIAIGGISLEQAPALFATGIDGIAVISDLFNASDPCARAKAWLAMADEIQLSLPANTHVRSYDRASKL